ncbi:MAG: sialidase family protein [Lentisphaerota bacterium]
MESKIRRISRTVIDQYNGRSVFPGFVSYVSTNGRTLLHRYGRLDFSDAYDDFADRLSFDNGKTWSVPVLRKKSYDVPEGRIRYAENACFFDTVRNLLYTFSSRALFKSNQLNALDPHAKFELTFDVYDPKTGLWAGEQVLPLSLSGDVTISFCFPIRTSSGRLLVPAYTMLLDPDGNPVHSHKENWGAVWQPVTIIGEFDSHDNLRWKAGNPVIVNVEKSSRGLTENCIAELADGSLAMVCRGDNFMFPERPGYKWICYSQDDGENWSEPEPMPCTEGPPIESSSAGSAFFRCTKTKKLYWIGNLCIRGERPNGLFPRSPLVVAEIQEQPFGLKRETISVIDERAPGETASVQMSNFRFYQDSETGDLIVLLSRYGERDAEKWQIADYYQYRISIS